MLGASPEELLRRVRARNTAGLTAGESAKLARLITYGAARASKRAQVDREIEAIWDAAEERLSAEIEAREAKRKAEVRASAAAKVAAERQRNSGGSRWW